MKKIPKPSRDPEVDKILAEFMSQELPEGFISEDASDTFIPTSASRVILSRLRVAAVEKYAFALVHGPAGSGKTITVKYFTEKSGAMFVRAHPEFRPSALLEELAIGLRITRTRNFRTLVAMIRDALVLRPMIVAVDEAQLAPRMTLETMKYLADETGSTFILITTDEFVGSLRRWRDIESRVGVTASISSIPLLELQSLYEESGFAREVVTAIHELSGGIMRDVLRVVRQVDHVIGLQPDAITREVMTSTDIKAIAGKLNLSGGRS